MPMTKLNFKVDAELMAGLYETMENEGFQNLSEYVRAILRRHVTVRAKRVDEILEQELNAVEGEES